VRPVVEQQRLAPVVYKLSGDMFGSTKASRCVACGMTVGLTMIAVCALIRPAGLGANDGASYYGDFRTTVIPYAIGYFTCAALYWRAATTLSREFPSAQRIANAVKAVAVAIASLVLAPHNLVGSVHIAIGATLFLLEMGLSVYLIAKPDPLLGRRWQGIVVLAFEFASGLAALYYLARHHGLLLQMQAIYQVAFALLLIMVFSGSKATARPAATG
jgi:hypothetical protein